MGGTYELVPGVSVGEFVLGKCAAGLVTAYRRSRYVHLQP